MYPTRTLTGGGFLYKSEDGFSSNCFICAGGLIFCTESRTFKIKGLALPADIGQDAKEIFMKRFQKLLAVLALGMLTACFPAEEPPSAPSKPGSSQGGTDAPGGDAGKVALFCTAEDGQNPESCYTNTRYFCKR